MIHLDANSFQTPIPPVHFHYSRHIVC